ncbi:EXS family-domain-containing protein [Apiospora arundinis]|uniref:EXS family-domain-containing protein n=1 Tax=Apiospora arundinis TaxID=335852 RepID=A0ABR2I418_9PEZI
MKFAKELEQDLVPEWRIKYLNYKAGKKYVKSVSRAISKVNGATPSIRRGELRPRKTPTSFQNRATPNDGLESRHGNSGSVRNASTVGPMATPTATRNEGQSLTRSPGNAGNYGSFVATPPQHSPLALATTTSHNRNAFALPGPAIDEPAIGSGRLTLQRSLSMDPVPDNKRSTTMPNPSMMTRTPSVRLRRLFSSGASDATAPEGGRGDMGMYALDTVRQREQEFFDFLDGELDKVETFYKQKEEQAGQRLTVLREQLHEMRNRRASELAEVKRRKRGEAGNGNGHHHLIPNGESAQGWIDPIKSKIFKPGPNSKALMKMPTTPLFSGGGPTEGGRDYVKKPHDHDVPYRTAKRKLKLALQEFYRGLELLKSYTLLNRTAFRKLNKKYDKAVNARPPYKYMNERVNKSWFVNSDVLDSHIIAVEDLYARYFEKGNHKIAAGKLRRLTRRPKDVSGSTFLNGIFIGIGAVFTLQGLVYGVELLFDPDPIVREQTTYLMQLYGGYFLMLYLFALFCGDCYLWNKNKINYPFIFEFDPRHHLDWRELAEFPSFCLLLLGVFIWLNFTRYGSPDMFLYYPVLLIFFTLVLILLPAPVLGHRSRKWFAYSHYRLFFAGLFPVEFRDFFLGDMYCSLTYATCNVELFFCLYARSWNDPSQCNSSHSRLLGFFNTVPAIWRAFQCIRRYADTKNMFPHLVNCGKYTMTILAAVMLSLYRIHDTHSNLALFVTFSTVNAIYCSIWDLLMDFSLLQPDARHNLLRDILALKRRWVYYFIMIVDPILRFAWIFYAIFTHDTQHSTAVSFLLGFAEVTRRGMWALLRVENEHCTNVAQYKASRDVPLPYHLDHEPLIERPSSEESTNERDGVPPPAMPVTSASAAPGETLAPVATAETTASESRTPDESGLRRRRQSEVRAGGESIRRIMAEAHRQDFEKKRRPAAGERSADAAGAGTVADIPSEEEDDDDDEEDDEDIMGERLEMRGAEQ